MKPKTAETRAQELFCMVHGKQAKSEFNAINSGEHNGWLKLGKFVLNLERKWTSTKRLFIDL